MFQIKQDDNLPKNICEGCVMELKSVASFIEKCKEIDKFLMSILEKSKESSFSPIYDLPHYESDGLDSHSCDEHSIKLEHGVLFDNAKTIIMAESDTKNVQDNFHDSLLKSFHCANCAKGFDTKRQLVVHIKTHSETKSFTCSLCSMKFKFRQSLQKHRLIHSIVRSYNCDICGKGDCHLLFFFK